MLYRGKKIMFKLLKEFLKKWLFKDENEVNKYVLFINSNEFLPPPLSKDEEEYYFKEFKNGNEYAKNKLIEHNLRLVVYVAKKYETNSSYLEDLVSIGCLGLIKAITTFDIDKNFKLATYASRCIENEILMHLRKTSKQKLEVSIDEPLNVDYDGNELLLADILSIPDDNVVEDLCEDEKRKVMYQAISELKPREKEIITLRYGLDSGEEMTQKDVADKLNISQSYISRLEKKIIKKLKNKLSA